jgi:hypothetical protein
MRRHLMSGLRILDSAARPGRTWVELGAHALLFWPLVLVLLPGIMRENDQASILHGAYLLSTGAADPLGADFYNYDKQFGSYWAVAGLLRAAGALDPIVVANVAQVLLFGVVVWLLYRKAAVEPTLPRRLALASLLSPVWLLDVSFLSTAIISASFYALAYFTSGLGHKGVRLGAGCGAIFVATACRADVVLALPFLVWLTSARLPAQRIVFRTQTVAYAAASGLALVIGRLVYTGSTFDTNSPSIVPQVIAAFTVFGLGVNGIILVLVLAGLLGAASVRRRHTWFYAFGAISLVLPFVFYLVQLFSPRYFVLTSMMLALLLVSRRAPALLRYLQHWQRQTQVMVGCAALAPLVLGVHAPSFNLASVRPTLGNPTVFPTAVGHWPMGAVWAFAASTRWGGEPAIDHNQAIFSSAMDTSFVPSCPDGRVAIARTPMSAFLELAATLKHQRARLIDLPGDNPCDTAYADLRSLSHTWRNWQESSGAGLRSALPNFSLAAPSRSGQPIVVLGPDESVRLRDIVQAFTDGFGGREFLVLADGSAPVPEVVALEPGLDYALASDEPPSLRVTCLDNEQNVQARELDSTLYVALMRAGDRAGCTLRRGASTQFGVLVRTVLPGYMTRIGTE